MRTVEELIEELSRIGETVSSEDNEILRDVALRLSALQMSLRQEVSRIEKLQPFATAICDAVRDYRGEGQ